MKKLLTLLSIFTLMTWGVLFLYYYTSGRIEKYLDPDFRIYALLSGIGFVLLAAFNFINRKQETGLCTHDHPQGETCDHDHHHAHDHSHSHACDHDHHHAHDHDHDCGHDHSHGTGDRHEHTPATAVAAVPHHHEESTSGVVFSLFVLLVPILVATGYSQDRFSAEYLTKWGKIERQMLQMRIARSRADEANLSQVGSTSNPYTREGIEAGASYPGAEPVESADTPPDPSAASGDKAGESWGAFTIEDLKKMVPQSEAGDFLLDVPQIFYTAGDRELMEVMEGIPVEATAQLMEETLNNPDKTRLKAFRLFIECCAADARPLSIPVDFGKAPPEYTEMGWYKLYGKLHYSHENGEIVPMIKIDRIEETTEPTDGLLF